MRADLVGINADKRLPRTKKIDMTPVRLEGDEDEEVGDGDDGDDDEDDDEDEDSTPVPRSKRHVARYLLLLPFFAYTYPTLCPRFIRKTTTARSAPVKLKSRRQDVEDEESGSGGSEPDSIIDSSSEEEADNEVDGMLGE